MSDKSVDIIVAAATIAGPHPGVGLKNGEEPDGRKVAAWLRDVETVATAIASLTAERHPLGKKVEQLLDSRCLVGIVKSIKRDDRTTRGQVELETGMVTQYTKDGIDRFGTERTDTASGLAMAKRIRELKGHRVRVWIENEGKGDQNANGGKGYKVVRRVEDLGVPKSQDND